MLWGSDWPLLATDLDNGKRLKNDQLKDLRPHLESIFNKPAPAAYQKPALTMAEIYANRGKVSG
ncbi:MAG: hypothetical protein M3Y08_13650 [Fibrobacterota bacterium]|nr:hypothetical protein [Fibrobacterota bacterium]